MSDNFDPFDPISAAMGAMHSQNLLAAKDARIKQLEAELERMTLENNQYEKHHKYGQNVITFLREEVERLTKYYIDPASILRLTEDGKQEKNGFGYITKFAIEVNKDAFERLSNVMMAYWNAAKEGKDKP